MKKLAAVLFTLLFAAAIGFAGPQDPGTKPNKAACEKLCNDDFNVCKKEAKRNRSKIKECNTKKKACKDNCGKSMV